jgi:hypothetical protein
MHEEDATVRERAGATDAMPKRKRLFCPVTVGTFKKDPASMLARRDVPVSGQHAGELSHCCLLRR